MTAFRPADGAALGAVASAEAPAQDSAHAASDAPAGGQASDRYVHAFAKGLAVICAFDPQSPMTITELAKAAELDRAGTRRILLTLETELPMDQVMSGLKKGAVLVLGIAVAAVGETECPVGWV